MSKPLRYTLSILGILILMLLLIRYVFFKEQFNEWGRGLERVGAWQEQYKQDHPNATKEEMDNAFDEGINSIEVWQTQYKKDHPTATKAEMDAAFTALWQK